MFDIHNYNIFVAFGSFFFSFSFLFFCFKKKSMGIIDPLTMHLLWTSGNFAFLTAFVTKNGFSPVVIIFFLVFVVYVFLLYHLLRPIKHENEDFDKVIKSNGIIYVVSVLLLLYAKKPILEYFLSHDFKLWFLYRYIAIEGGNPFYRILDLGVTPIFMYLTFFNIHILKKKNYVYIVGLIIFSVISLLAGGRSFMLSLIFIYGSFVVFYRGRFFQKKTLNKVNKIGKGVIAIAVLLAIVISSMFKEDYTLKDGTYVIMNRVIATADGMEYYINYNGIENIQSGAYEYFMSIFGVYVKNILGVEHKNVGHQLSELVAGGKIDFAQGSNYTLPLQVMVIGYVFMFAYLIISTNLVARLRNIKANLGGGVQIPRFFLFSFCFGFVTDPEFFVLRTISFVLIYFTIFYPLIKFKI